MLTPSNYSQDRQWKGLYILHLNKFFEKRHMKSTVARAISLFLESEIYFIHNFVFLLFCHLKTVNSIFAFIKTYLHTYIKMY